MQLQLLIDAINHTGVVSGLTHDLYRYPARFSPLFARAAILLFTKPGDTVLDPFSGSSTSLVESLALGRHAVGTDINELAVFLARAKTLMLADDELDNLRNWAERAIQDLSPRKPVVRHTEWMAGGYQTNLPWRFRKVAEQALNSAASEFSANLLIAARCVVLKTLQWAVDCKKHLPSAADFRRKIVEDTEAVTAGLQSLRNEVESRSGGSTKVEAHQCRAEDIAGLDSELLRRYPPKLIVTSPPYPAVHVLYHRWQVLGRRETAAPYWIADCYDSHGAAFYTFGDRRHPEHDNRYFERLRRCFAEVRKVIRDDAVVIQLVGFARPDEQLPLYMGAMEKAGFKVFDFRRVKYRPRAEEFWRAVPNRKWYTWLRTETMQTKEILLVHQAR